jgi:cysteine synthase
VLVPQIDGTPGRVTGNAIASAAGEARKIADERHAYYVDPFNNDGSVMAHFEGTGPEIHSATHELDGFVAIVGSGGTFVGTSRFLKSARHGIRCFAVEPDGVEVLAGKEVVKSRHLLQILSPPYTKRRPASVLKACVTKDCANRRIMTESDAGQRPPFHAEPIEDGEVPRKEGVSFGIRWPFEPLDPG